MLVWLSVLSTLSPSVHPSLISVCVCVCQQQLFMFAHWSFLSFSWLQTDRVFGVTTVSVSAPSHFLFDPTVTVYLRLIDAFSYSCSHGWVMPQTDWCWHTMTRRRKQHVTGAWRSGSTMTSFTGSVVFGLVWSLGKFILIYATRNARISLLLCALKVTE